MVKREQKITLGEMCEMSVRGLLIYCSDHHCSHWTAISGDQWADDVRLSDVEPLLVRRACGLRGADVRPNFHWEAEARRAKSRRLCENNIGARRSSGFRDPSMTLAADSTA